MNFIPVVLVGVVFYDILIYVTHIGLLLSAGFKMNLTVRKLYLKHITMSRLTDCLMEYDFSGQQSLLVIKCDFTFYSPFLSKDTMSGFRTLRIRFYI